MQKTGVTVFWVVSIPEHRKHWITTVVAVQFCALYGTSHTLAIMSDTFKHPLLTYSTNTCNSRHSLTRRYHSLSQQLRLLLLAAPHFLPQSWTWYPILIYLPGYGRNSKRHRGDTRPSWHFHFGPLLRSTHHSPGSCSLEVSRSLPQGAITLSLQRLWLRQLLIVYLST